MGSGTDYSNQVSQGLNQANTPKSALSQQYSGLLGGVAPGILNALMNTQNLGNSFLNVNGASSNQNGPQNWGGPHRNPINPPQIQPPTGGIQPPGPPQIGVGPPQIAMENNDLGPPQQRFPQGMGNGDLGPPQHGFDPSMFNQGGMGQSSSMANPSIMGLGDQGSGGGALGVNNPTDTHGQTINVPWFHGSTGAPFQLPTGIGNPQQMSTTEQNSFQQGQGMNVGQGQQGGIDIAGFQKANPQLAQMLGMGSFSNTNPQIQQLLGGVGNNPQQVNAQQVGPSGFNQQMADPSMISDPNFQAQGANLNGINTGTQLSGDSLNSYNNIAQILGNQQKQAMADQHERFTGVGGARSSGASLADAQMQAQMQPQMAQALSGARNNEVSNQLQSAGLQSSNALQNAGMMNQYGLGGAQLNVQRQGQNISNMMNAAGINNQYGLGNAQLGAQIGQGNQSANLQGQMANQGAGLQNQGQNNNLLAQLLGQQGQNVGQTNNANLGMNSIMQGLSQGNAQGANQYNLATAGMNQQAALQQQSQAQNALMALFGMGGSLAGAGIPGGSANINVGGQQGSNFGSNMQGLASIMSMFGG